MSLLEDMHDHQARLASASAGNSFDKPSNQIPPPDLFGAAPQSPIWQPIQTGGVPAFAGISTQDVAQRAALANREGQYDGYMRVVPQLVASAAENAALKARWDVQQQSAMPTAALLQQVATGLAVRAPDVLCNVLPFAGSIAGGVAGFKLARMSASTGPGTTFLYTVAGVVIGAYLMQRISPCGAGPQPMMSLPGPGGST
jgi:hypothetical protein